MRTIRRQYDTIPMLSRAAMALGLLFLWSGAFAQENFRVADVSIVGNEELDDDDLQNAMDTYGTTWLGEHVLAQQPCYFNREIFERDLESVRRLYQSEGFVDVRIGPVTLHTDTPERRMAIVIPIDEGPPTTVDTVSWRIALVDSGMVARLDSLRDALSARLALRVGERFRDDAVRKDAADITTAMGDLGYARAKVTYDLGVDHEQHVVRIRWSVLPGPQCTFGPVTIRGLKRFPESWVQEKLRFQRGESYSNQALENSRLAVSNLGLYQAVAMRTSIDSSGSSIPVTVAIEEAKASRLRFGVGYGRDEGFRVTADVTFTGLLSGKGRLNLKVRRSDLEPFFFAVTYTHPDFLKEDLTLLINPFFRNQAEPAYDARRIGSRISLQHSIVWDVQGSLSWNLEHVNLDTASIATPNKLPGLEPEYYKSSFTIGLNRNSARPYFDPAGGMYSAVLFTYAGPPISGQYNYTKFITDLRKYGRLSKRITLAARVKLGVSHARQGGYIPVEERFYAGGAVSVRGWGRHRLGPQDEQGIPVGGVSLLEGGVEGRFPIVGDFSWAAFLDFGNVWIDEWHMPLSELRYSAGAGLRYNTPIGPIRLDAARPVWDEESAWQFFFSIGQAF